MSVVVIHDGHRRKVAVTPGTLMSEVLQRAHSGYGLTCIEKYRLTTKGNTIDLSLPFRLTGVPMNALIDLEEVKGVSGQTVRVCIQLTNGQRVQGNFEPSLTLQQILGQLNISVTSPLSYLRREIKHEEFTSTTLQVLGLVSGSVMFRVVGISQPVLNPPTVAAPAPPVKQQTVPPATTILTPHSPKGATISKSKPYQNTDVNAQLDDLNSDHVISTQKLIEMSAYDAIQLVRNRNFDTVSKDVVLTLLKILCNILSKPGDSKVRSIRVANAKFHEAIAKHGGGIEFLLAVGFQFDATKENLQLVDEVISKLQHGLDVLYAEADDLNIDPASRPNVVVLQTSSSVEFDAFKPVITRFQAQPRGASITEMQLEDLKKKREAILDVKIPPRATRIFFPHEQLPSMTSESSQGEGGGGSSDSQLLAQAMRARREENEKNQGFRTKAMRELDELKKKSVFQNTVLRIRFPDQVVFQANFHPNETIQAVVMVLEESMKRDFLHFSLYMTPPKKTIDLNGFQTLEELNLVPAALIYLSWSTPIDSLQIGFYFSNFILETLCSETKEDDDMTSIQYPSSHLLVHSQEIQIVNKKSSKSKPSWLKL